MSIERAGFTIPMPARVNPDSGEKKAEGVGGIDFGRLLETAYEEVIESQRAADVAINEFATGGDIDIHEVVIAAEQASLTLSLAVQVRNKVVEAFQELLRIQV
jgi:flagellar hook-basal body complex protein FliE